MMKNRALILVLLSFVCISSFSQNITDVLFGKDCKKNYIGQYNYNGKRKNGFGIERYRNGSVYVGDFSENVISGRGMLIMSDGQIADVENAVVYAGNWLKGKKNGRGICYDSSGNMVYYGKFVNDKPTEHITPPKTQPRFALSSMKNGLYLGETIDDIPNGLGLMAMNDGIIIYGTMKQGEWQGACMTCYTADVWEIGQWKDGVYTPFNNSQVAEAKLQEFRVAKKEWKEEMRSNLFEVFGNFAQVGLSAVTIANDVKASSNKGTLSQSGENSHNSTSSKNGKGKQKDASLANWKSLDKAYGGYENQLIRMKNSGDYDIQEVRNIQSKMKDIRAKIRQQSGGYERAVSPLETWNP